MNHAFKFAGVLCMTALSLSGCSMLGLGGATSYRTMHVSSGAINLATRVVLIKGEKMRCVQNVEKLQPDDDGGFLAVIRTQCRPV